MKTVEDLLTGTSRDRVQRVGAMQVIPILGDDNILFDVPSSLIVEDVPSQLGIKIHNSSNKAVIVPHGFRLEGAMKHTVQSVIVQGRESKEVGGFLASNKNHSHMMPASMRSVLMSEGSKEQMWRFISNFNYDFGIESNEANLGLFEERYQKQLDTFSSEFELVPNQIGALFVIGNKVAGIEMAPNQKVWTSIWKSIVRDSYGPLAIKQGRKLESVGYRLLTPEKSTLESLMESLIKTREMEEDNVDLFLEEIMGATLKKSTNHKESFVNRQNVSTPKYGISGTIMTVEGGINQRVSFASISI